MPRIIYKAVNSGLERNDSHADTCNCRWSNRFYSVNRNNSAFCELWGNIPSHKLFSLEHNSKGFRGRRRNIE